MGMFDTVITPCPNCGKPLAFQTKADPNPSMERWTLENAPRHILCDIVNAPEHHQACGAWGLPDRSELRAARAPPPRPAPIGVVLKPPEKPYENQGYKWWPDFEPVTLDHVDVEHAPSKAALDAILATRTAVAEATRRAAATEDALTRARAAIRAYDAGGALQDALNALRSCAALALAKPDEQKEMRL